MSKCWYCNNELTGGDNPKHFGICNKCYDEMFKSSDTIISSFTNKIAELQKQLEEKEKEIEQLKKFDDLNKTFFNLFRTAFKEPDKVDDLFNTLKTIQEKHNQDKISFAIEQLEKVKELFLIESKENPIVYDISDDIVGGAIDKDKCFSIIDQIIKELKGKVEDEQSRQ